MTDVRVEQGADNSGGRGERVLGESLLARAERAFRQIDRPFAAIPRHLDPMAQTGAVANVAFIVAIITGIALLLWYVPSVNRAYDSVAAMGEQRWVAGAVRSLHRYSSDACMFFVLLHAARTTAERRFGGARWVAWVTGVASVTLIWFVGWTGYWLVWDQAGQEVALGTARLLDVVPVFTDPLSRTFLTDEGINPLIFFLVFFFHMLLPLAVAVGVWLHISRLRRARFLTGRPLTIAIVASLILVSIAVPAPLGERAAMLVTPDGFPLDAWYLLPLMLTERLGPAVLWSFALIAGVVVYTVPWTLVRTGVQKAIVDPAKCDECMKCFVDCPYGAISMIPRTDGNTRFETQAWVDPNLCIGCSICSGSCDSSGIGLDWLPAPKVRLQTDAWLKESSDSVVVYVCDPSAPPELVVDGPSGHSEQLPGCRVVRTPCAGWVHPLTVERALKKGASGVLIVGCPDGACPYREGGATTAERVSGAREPSLRLERVDASKVHVLREHAVTAREIAAAAARVREGKPPVRRKLPPAVVGIVGSALALGIIVGLSHIPYSTSYASEPEMVVSVKHAGVRSDVCHERTPEELAELPVHMRQPTVCERGRADVRVRVTIDGTVAQEHAFEAPGVESDGIVTGMVRLSAAEGAHDVLVEVADGPDGEWSYTSERRLLLEPRHRTVVTFERGAFTWYAHDDE